MITEDRAIAIDADFRILDVYAGGIVDEPPRIEALATISAGAKNEKGLPFRSQDGRIFLHDANGRAPELEKALAATDYKRLTVAFPFHNPAQFIQQRYAAYSASALLAYGNEREITVLEGGRRVVAASSKEYSLWLAKCKVQASIFFCLSEWAPDGAPVVSMPDGLAFYRLRTTSRNSLRSIMSTLNYAGTFTGRRIAGLPFTLSLEQRDVAMADGKRQRVPVWVMVLQPPGGVHLTSRTFSLLARQALEEAAELYLLPPADETVDTALGEAGEPYAVDDEDFAISDDDAERLATGTAPCDAAYWNSRWHAVAAGTMYQSDDVRHAFVAAFTAANELGATSSLAAFLARATDAEATALLSALELATQNAADVMTGELPMDDEERLAAAGTRAAELFDGEIVDDEPEPPTAPEFDPTADIERFHDYVKNRGAAGSIQVPWDRATEVGDRLSAVLQSVGKGIDIARFLVDNPKAAYRSLTLAQADGLMKLADLPKARERLMAVHALAEAWLVAQQTAAKEQAGAMV